MSANPVLDNLRREAVLETQKDALWSLDMLAYHLHSDPITVRRWLRGYEPETDVQIRNEDRLLSNVDAFLASYVPKDPLRRIMNNTVGKRSRPSDLVTHCPQGHAYDEMNTGIQPSGKRYCITCRKERYGHE